MKVSLVYTGTTPELIELVEKEVRKNIGPDAEIISSQDHEHFLACLEGLPDLYRDVAKMCFIENLEYKTIAEKTGLSMNTVKTRISRAKNIIVQMMLDLEE